MVEAEETQGSRRDNLGVNGSLHEIATIIQISHWGSQSSTDDPWREDRTEAAHLAKRPMRGAKTGARVVLMALPGVPYRGWNVSGTKDERSLGAGCDDVDRGGYVGLDAPGRVAEIALLSAPASDG